MKKGWIIGIIAVLLIIALIVIFYNKQTEKGTYDESKEVNLWFNNSLSYLKECKSVEGQDRSNLSQYLRECPSQLPNQTVFSKLELIKDFRGILECELKTSVSECDWVVGECELLTSFSYQISATSGGNSPTTEGVVIYDCNGDYYLSKSDTPPLRKKLYRINLTEEIITKLKEEPQLDLIKEWGEGCSNFVYGSVWETVHGGSYCYHVYQEAFYNNNSIICNYLKSELDKAKCLGTSVEKWEDKERCYSLSENNKEICILNVLKKLEQVNFVENLRGVDVCEDISNQSIKSICLGYESIINSNYSICIKDDVVDNTCRNHFLSYNKNILLTKNICEDLFTEPEDLFSCYRYSLAINLTEVPGDTRLFENIPGIVNGQERPTNHSLFFSILNIPSDYPYFMTYSISYWDKNPYWVEGESSSSISEYLYHLVSSEHYICKTPIKNISEINNSCLTIDLNYKSLPPSVSIGIWNYGI